MIWQMKSTNLLAYLRYSRTIFFGDATYELNKNKNVRLRKPSQLPDEDDVKTVRDHVMKRMKELVEEPFNFL